MTSDEQTPAMPSQPKTRVRISDEMRQCIEFMATEGLPAPVAAARAGITRDTAVRNMRKPHVLKLFKQRVREIRDNAAQQAYMRINHTAQTSTSERIKLDANKWIAGVDGVSPVQKVQGQHLHSHTFSGFDYPDLDPVDVTPDEDAS